MSKLTNREIALMKKRHEGVLISFLVKQVTLGDLDKAFNILYNSITYRDLKDTRSNFYWKSYAEMKYLMQMELEGNTEEWNIHAMQS